MMSAAERIRLPVTAAAAAPAMTDAPMLTAAGAPSAGPVAPPVAAAAGAFPWKHWMETVLVHVRGNLPIPYRRKTQNIGLLMPVISLRRRRGAALAAIDMSFRNSGV